MATSMQDYSSINSLQTPYQTIIPVTMEVKKKAQKT